MAWHRFAHLNSINVRVGQIINTGEVIGTLGNTGFSTGPHLHWDIPGQKPSPWGEWVRGKSKAWVRAHYGNPHVFLRNNPSPAPIHHYGYNYLTRTSTGVYHPGIDINSTASAWGDLGTPIKAPCYGKVHYVRYGNKGFGNYVVIEQLNKPMAKIYWADFVGQGFVNDKNEYIHGSNFFMKNGEKKDLWFEAKNSGNVDWPVRGDNSVMISARGFAPFRYKWINPEQITQAEDFYAKQGVIKPGELVKFRATFKAPDYPTELKDYPIYMLMENAAWFNDYQPIFKVNFSIGDKPRLRKAKGDKTVWWLSNGKRHGISSPVAAETWFGSDWTHAVQPISQKELDTIEEGKVLK